MSNIADYASLDGSKWGHALQESALSPEPKEAKERLQGRKVITRLEDQEKIYTINEIFQITMHILGRANASNDLREIKRGLLHIQDTLQGADDFAAFKERMSAVDGAILKNLLAKEGNLEDEDLAVLKQIAKINPKLLLEKLEGLLAKCSKNESLALFEALIQQTPKFDSPSFTLLQKYLFHRSEDESSIFELLMTLTNSNYLFDLLLPKLDSDQLNENTTWKNQVLSYAFSPKCFEAVFWQDGDVSESLAQDMEELTIRARQLGARDVQPCYDASTKASGTLTQPSPYLKMALANWQTALDFMRRRAMIHKQQPPPAQDVNYLQMMGAIHVKLTKGDPEIQAGGTTRDEIACINRCGGSWRRIYCPPSYLQQNIQTFHAWLDRELEKCNKGEKNPILLAAQVNERLMTFHMYENGNGRITQLMFNYILERFGLPPAIVSTALQATRFPLMTINKNPESVVRQLMAGIEQSLQILSRIEKK